MANFWKISFWPLKGKYRANSTNLIFYHISAHCELLVYCWAIFCKFESGVMDRPFEKTSKWPIWWSAGERDVTLSSPTSSNWWAHPPSILANGLTGMLLSKLCALDPLNNSKRKTISGILHKCQMRSCAIFAHLIYYPASFAEIWSAICDYKNIIVICQTAFVVVPNLGSLLLYNIHVTRIRN